LLLRSNLTLRYVPVAESQFNSTLRTGYKVSSNQSSGGPDRGSRAVCERMRTYLAGLESIDGRALLGVGREVGKDLGKGQDAFMISIFHIAVRRLQIATDWHHRTSLLPGAVWWGRIFVRGGRNGGKCRSTPRIMGWSAERTLFVEQPS
jgi:hypothetical protein